MKLAEMNLLVGPNNCGKSTIVSAFRILEVALRIAHRRKLQRVWGPDGYTLGYPVPPDILPFSLDNIHTDLADVDSAVQFQIANGNRLLLHFSPSAGCVLIPSVQKGDVQTPTAFRKQFPIQVVTVPVLGPVDQDEELRTDETIKRSLGTPRASRHFRNYWRLTNDGFDDFARMVEETWPGMRINRPEMLAETPPRLVMFCEESGLTRELAWSGSGFQIWCQLLTHICRARSSSLLVIDEPEIYLHPDLQRHLLEILRNLDPSIVVATHSTEIIADSDPSEVVMIDKTERSARRLKDVEGLQSAIESIGSVHNVTLTKLARTRRVLFVEGKSDFKRIRRFARKLGMIQLASGLGVSPLLSHGFSSWKEIRVLGEMLERTLGVSLSLGAIYDRDYWCDAEIASIGAELRTSIAMVRIHERKEFENYLLIPSAMQRIVDRELSGGQLSVSNLLIEISDQMHEAVFSQYTSRRVDYFKRSPRDSSTLTHEAVLWFKERWMTLDRRLCIVPGKEVLKSLQHRLKEEHGVNLTEAKIIDEMRKDEIPLDLLQMMNEVDAYCQGRGARD